MERQWPQRFGLRMVDFMLSRTSSVSTARSSLFRKSQWPLYQTGQPQWPLYQSQPLRKLHLTQLLKLLTKLLIQLLKLLTKLLIKLLFKLLSKLLLKLLIKLLLKLRTRSLDKVHKEDSALR